MSQHFVHIHALLRVFQQQVLDEPLRLLLDWYAGWEGQFRQLGLLLLVLGDLDDVALEGGFAEQQFVGEDAETPGVDFVAVALFAELFGRGVFETAHHCGPEAEVVVVDGAPEVSYLDVALNRSLSTS